MGNSEVGHPNIGASRVIYRIHAHRPGVRTGEFVRNPLVRQ
jgi:bisphosphoglycerate-independent phosphoglycerate mutase (AlkP superfamily)